MVDRIQTRSFTNKTDHRLQALTISPYAKQQLQLAELLNHRGQIVSYNDYLRSLSRRKRQRCERETITQEIILRALKIDRSHRLSRRHQFEVAARRAVNSNFEILSRKYKKSSHEYQKDRQKSAPGFLPKTENDGQRRIRVTSAYNGKSKSDKDLQELDPEQSRSERLNILNVSAEERHACQMTMSYGFTTTASTEELVRDEVVVMQQHSTGENLVVYRGFLVEGESFSFKSQRRHTSPLSLAFYAKGIIDSVVNDCCEFKYGRRNHHTNEHHQFLVKRIRKGSPCEKCRRQHSQRALASDATGNEHSQKVRRGHLTPTIQQIPVDNEKQVSSEKKHSGSKLQHGNKKTGQNKKHSTTVDTAVENEFKEEKVSNHRKSKKTSSKSSSKQHITKEGSSSIDVTLSESALVHETTSNNPPAVKERSNVKSPTASEGDQTIQQWINQTDVVPTGTDSSSESISASDAGNVSQMFMTHLKQQLQKLSHRAQSSGEVRHDKSVENFIYILDGNLQISTVDQKKLRGLVNFGLTFDDINTEACTEFITQIVKEQIILILSKTSMENLDTIIRDASQLRFIYILDNTKKSFNDFPKIRGIHTTMTNVCDQLERDIKLFTYDFPTILSVSSDDTSDSHFAYIQVLKDILLETDEKTDLKKDMLDFCRQEYVDNEIQLKLIDEFEHHFQSDEAVKWYTREETFIFKMLTRAFRTPDPDILFKLRFFIQHLHCQLKSNVFTTPMIVYRTQLVSKEDFDKIINNQGGFLTFSEFVFANKNRITTKSTAEIPFVNSEYKSILFQMEIGTTIPRMDIQTIPQEIIITAATVFRIANVEQVNDETSIVKLISNDDISKAVHEITKSVRESARGPFPLLRMAKLMKQMEYMRHTEYFCLTLLHDSTAVSSETANLILGGLFHSLCSFYYEQEQYDRALDQLHKSLEAYSRVLSLDDIKLTPTYNNMGSIYHKQGLEEQALQFHKKAYDIQAKSANPDPDSVAAYAGNIASVLVKQGKYDEAIEYLKRDLQIRQRLHPNSDDVHLAVKYHNLAGAQFRANKHTDALENYGKCLEIELKLHPSTHPTVAVTYYNMATTLEGLGRLEEAIETIKKAIERLLLTKDENDEEVQMHQQYEKRLQQKLWVKSLFGTT